MAGARVRSVSITLVALVGMALAAAACDATVVGPSSTVDVSDAPDDTPPSSDIPAEPTPTRFAPSGPLRTIDPAVLTGLPVSCGIDDSTFPPATLAGPGAELAPDAAAAALREFLLTEPTPEYPFPRTGWHRVVQTADRELFVAPTAGDPPWLAVAFMRTAGAWVLDAYGTCSLTVALPEGIGLADWWVNPGAPPPTPQSTNISILFQERACAGAQSPNERLLAPVVVYRPDAVVITMAVRSVPGAADCPGNPTIPFVVDLTEPLRDRVLLDGGTVPPRAPAPPTDG